MTNVRKAKSKTIEKSVLWEDYYMNLHDAHNSMIMAFEKRAADEGLTADQLAQLLDVDKSLISRRLNGRDNLTLKTLSNMATALRCKLGILFNPYEAIPRSNYPVASPSNPPIMSIELFKENEMAHSTVKSHFYNQSA